MPSLFSDIQGFFSARYSGRYFALLLRELARREPELFARIFGFSPDLRKALLRRELQVEYEWPFDARRRRRADLAVLRGGEPVLLLEVKEDDIKNPRNPEQLSDYLSLLDVPSPQMRQPPKLQFVHVSRFALPPEELSQMEEARKAGKMVLQLRYRKIYETLRQHGGALGQMLQEYLEDIGVASYDIIDLASDKEGRSLAFLLIQILGFPHFHGLGKLHSDKAINDTPKLFKILFGNLEVLGDWIKDHNQSIFRTRFTRRFKPAPIINLNALRKSLAKDASGADIGLGDHVRGGEVYFYASGKIANPRGGKQTLTANDWLYVEVGYWFSLSKGGFPIPTTMWLYANFFWRGRADDHAVWTKDLQTFPTEVQAVNLLHDCLSRAHRDALKEAPSPFRDALMSFKVPPAA